MAIRWLMLAIRLLSRRFIVVMSVFTGFLLRNADSYLLCASTAVSGALSASSPQIF